VSVQGFKKGPDTDDVGGVIGIAAAIGLGRAAQSLLRNGQCTDWDRAAISFRVDPDVLAYFRSESSRSQSRMHEVLRAYVDHQRAKKASK
jgi:hypothetical protein